MKAKYKPGHCCCGGAPCLKYSSTPADGKPWPAWTLLSGTAPTIVDNKINFNATGKIRYNTGVISNCSGVTLFGHGDLIGPKRLFATVTLLTDTADITITTLDTANYQHKVRFFVASAPNYPVVHVIWTLWRKGIETYKSEAILDRYNPDWPYYSIAWRNTDDFPDTLPDPLSECSTPTDPSSLCGSGAGYVASRSSITALTPRYISAPVSISSNLTTDGGYWSEIDDSLITIELTGGRACLKDMRLYYGNSFCPDAAFPGDIPNGLPAGDPCPQCPTIGRSSPSSTVTTFRSLDCSYVPIPNTVTNSVIVTLPTMEDRPPEDLPLGVDPCDDCTIGGGDQVRFWLVTQDRDTDLKCNNLYERFEYSEFSGDHAWGCGDGSTGHEFSGYIDLSLDVARLGWTQTPEEPLSATGYDFYDDDGFPLFAGLNTISLDPPAGDTHFIWYNWYVAIDNYSGAWTKHGDDGVFNCRVPDGAPLLLDVDEIFI